MNAALEQPAREQAPASLHGSRLLALVAVAAGSLSILLGLGLVALGMGFGNATASGTGAAATVVGLWSIAAWHGLAGGRRVTYLGLSLAWAWLFARIVYDFPATASSVVVVLFLLPSVTLPVVLAWLSCGGIAATMISVKTARAGYRWLAARQPLPGSWSKWFWLAARFSLVLAVTLIMTRLAWLERGTKIARLANEYGPASSGNSERSAPALGACSMVFLGYSLTEKGDSKKEPAARQAAYQKVVADAKAEVETIAAAGARYVRVGASGDHLQVDKPNQEEVDDLYMASVKQTGLPLVLVDTQHPKFARNARLTWDDFCDFQARRIEYYLLRYRPAVYQVVCEPMSYHGFVLKQDVKYSAEAWSAQLSAMCRRVKEVHPATRTAICLLVMKDKEQEWEVWSRMQTLPELDILAVEIYQPDDFASTRERLDKYGHPKKFGKQFWVAETYNGWAMCGDRRWDQDAAWVGLAADFGRTVDAEAVLVWTFGTFAPGGSFWDFMFPGRYKARWGAGDKLSVVGEEFSRLALHSGS